MARATASGGANGKLRSADVSFDDSDNLVGVAAKARLSNAVIGVDAVLALPESRRVHDCIITSATSMILRVAQPKSASERLRFASGSSLWASKPAEMTMKSGPKF
jgi:hypothetical protein